MKGAFAWRNNNHAIPIQPNKNDIVKAMSSGYKLQLHYQKNKNHLKGVADIIGLLPSGQFIGIEIKTGKDKQSADQKYFEEEIKKRNGIYIIIRNTDQLIKEIKKLF